MDWRFLILQKDTNGVTFYDAVYHAVAMLKKGVLLTADEAYYKKVNGMTNIIRLKNLA